MGVQRQWRWGCVCECVCARVYLFALPALSTHSFILLNTTNIRRQSTHTHTVNRGLPPARKGKTIIASACGCNRVLTEPTHTHTHTEQAKHIIHVPTFSQHAQDKRNNNATTGVVCHVKHLMDAISSAMAIAHELAYNARVLL